MKIHLLSSCGLWIESGETHIGIDLLNGDLTPFYRISDGNIDCILSGKRKVDALIYTHGHQDHYDLQLNQNFRTRFPETPICIPDEDTPNRGKLHFGDIEIDFFRVRHTGEEYLDVPHCAYLIQAEGKKLLICGDGDVDALGSAFPTERFDCIFANTLLLSLSHGRRLLQRAGEIFIYHLPEEVGDTSGMVKKARLSQARFCGELPPVTLCCKYPKEI